MPATVSQALSPNTARTSAIRIIANLIPRPSECPLKRLAGGRDIPPDALHGLAGRKAEDGNNKSETDHGIPLCDHLDGQPSAAARGRQVIGAQRPAMPDVLPT